MTIPRTILVAASRWLRLLEHTDVNRARSALHNSASFTDITPTQYATALEWLRTESLVNEYIVNAGLHVGDADLTESVMNAVLMQLFQEMPPPWLPIANDLVSTVEDIPADLADWMDVLGMAEDVGLRVLEGYLGRIDLDGRAALGAEGEARLVESLEDVWPGSTSHVALHSDGLGYDIAFRHGRRVWHLEVKSTRSPHFDRVFVSRHEFEVSLRDPNWVLVLLRLDRDGLIRRMATGRPGVLQDRAPVDIQLSATWESCRFSFSSEDIFDGLCLGLGIPADESRLALFRTGTAMRNHPQEVESALDAD